MRRKRWPSKQVPWGTFQYCGDRNAYRERHIASLKFEFLDPAEWHIATSRARVNHILIEGDYILVAQVCVSDNKESNEIILYCTLIHHTVYYVLLHI